jgi:hypothetical protein
MNWVTIWVIISPKSKVGHYGLETSALKKEKRGRVSICNYASFFYH